MDLRRAAQWKGARTEQPVELPKPMPVYLIYQTAVPSGDQVVFYQDIYGKDRSMLAGSARGQGRGSRRCLVLASTSPCSEP